MEPQMLQAADAQAELERLRDRISELEQEKADLEAFAAVAAHELLAPVVMMDACAAMVTDRLDQGDHPESRRALRTTRRGAPAPGGRRPGPHAPGRRPRRLVGGISLPPRPKPRTRAAAPARRPGARAA